MNDPIFQKMLDTIGYKINNELIDGEIKKVTIDYDTLVMTIDIVFPTVPNVAPLAEFNEKIKLGLVQANYASGVNINYEYANQKVDNEILKDYYDFTLKALIAKKLIYRSLNSFDVVCENNEIKIFVGGGCDKTIVEPLFEMVHRSFLRLGLNFITFTISVNQMVLPVSDTIDISRNEDVRNEISHFNNEKVSTKPSTVKEEKKERGSKPNRQTSKINGKVSPISSIPYTESELIEYNQRKGSTSFVIVGKIEKSEVKILPSKYRIYEGIISDDTGSITIKTFISDNKEQNQAYYETKASAGNKMRIYGYAENDKYSKDVVLKILDCISYGISEDDNVVKDDALVKRVELHAHSKMTFIDSILDIEEYVKRAVQFGHKAIALTDKNSVQGLGELLHCLNEEKSNIKPIYGMEASYVDGDKGVIAFTDEDISIKDATYVVYDLETTGLATNFNKIIEIGACKVKNGQIIDEFSTFVNPQEPLSQTIISLTHISNDDLRNAPLINNVLPKFMKFCQGCVLVGHNVKFDNSFIYRNLRELGLYEHDFPTIDTMQMAKIRYSKKLKRFGLDDVRKAFGVALEQHHRAVDDAKATAEIFMKMYFDLINDGINNYNEINKVIPREEYYKYVHPSHLTLLAMNRVGLVNLNRIVSNANVEHFYNKGAKLEKNFLLNHREGILIGSGCYHGEVFECALNNSYDKLLEVVSFYDYIEVQPIDAYKHLFSESHGYLTKENVKEVIKKIIKAGKEKGILVVATGDVHQLDAKDELYRKILYSKNLSGGGIHEFAEREDIPDQHYRTTQEMLDQFDFLDKELAYEIVVTNTNKIADMIEEFPLFPKGLHAPKDDFMEAYGIPSAKEEVERLTYSVAKEKYGDPLPKIVEDRLNKELSSIIGNDYATIYYIAYCLVKHSRDAGYVVGSRGSIGSSLVATFMKITEVNSLTTHYLCPNCHFTAFKYSEDDIKKYKPNKLELDLQQVLNAYPTGLDLPQAKCPICGGEMQGNGCNIPFETFLGFKGDKVPDIDLNFSGEYQAKAHAFCREIFGTEYTYRGGTIGKIANRTAENYINDYYVKMGKLVRKCEITKVIPKIEGIKRQTGQHPGGIVVVPKGYDINEVTPIQYPADDITSEWKTTHIDYHKFEANLLKLDILGHDDPTMIRYLMNFVDANPSEFPFTCVEDIPLNDSNVLKMFSGVEVLGVNSLQIRAEVASNGLPEFGTTLAKNMLTTIRPTTIGDLIKISGLSHGTNVWQGNAKEYFLGTKGSYGKIPFEDLIGCRDDIMTKLIDKGIPAQIAFKIMESVRKGRGLSAEFEKTMRKNNVDEWFIESCKIIKYLFPKAHAAAYVTMALRIAWFKLYKPLYYYSGFFSKRTDAFDVVTLMGGYATILKKVDELSQKYGREKASNDEDDSVETDTTKDSKGEEKPAKKFEKMLVGLQIALEMLSRGYEFKPVHINKSDAVNFIIEGNALRIPFITIDSFGENTAKQLVSNRGNIPFTSIKDAARRGHISNTLVDKLMQLGAFEGLPKEDEIGLFKFLKDEDSDNN